jgi:hypothetical protein
MLFDEEMPTYAVMQEREDGDARETSSCIGLSGISGSAEEPERMSLGLHRCSKSLLSHGIVYYAFVFGSSSSFALQPLM